MKIDLKHDNICEMLLSNVSSLDSLGLFLTINYYIENNDLVSAKKTLKELLIISKGNDVMTALAYRSASIISLILKDIEKLEKSLILYNKYLCKTDMNVSIITSFELLEVLKSLNDNKNVEVRIDDTLSNSDYLLNSIMMEEVEKNLILKKSDIDNEFESIRKSLLNSCDNSNYLRLWKEKVEFDKTYNLIFRECNNLIDNSKDESLVNGLLNIIRDNKLDLQYPFIYNYLNNKFKYLTKKDLRISNDYKEEIKVNNSKNLYSKVAFLAREAYDLTNDPEFLYLGIDAYRKMGDKKNVLYLCDKYLENGYLHLEEIMKYDKIRFKKEALELEEVLGIDIYKEKDETRKNYLVDRFKRRESKKTSNKWETLDV